MLSAARKSGITFSLKRFNFPLRNFSRSVSRSIRRCVRRPRKVTSHLRFSQTNQHHGASLLHGTRRATCRRGGSRKSTVVPPADLQNTFRVDGRSRSRVRSGQNGDIVTGRRFSKERHGMAMPCFSVRETFGNSSMQTFGVAPTRNCAPPLWSWNLQPSNGQCESAAAISSDYLLFSWLLITKPWLLFWTSTPWTRWKIQNFGF